MPDRTRDRIRDTKMQAMNAAHRCVLRLSGRRLGARLANMAVCTVTTTGRTSGQPRTVFLTAPIQHDDTYVFVASKGGDDRHPDWYQNMVAHPAFLLEPADGRGPLTLVARTATDDERAELWPRIVAAHQGYGSYQAKTDRTIPVVIAQPAPG